MDYLKIAGACLLALSIAGCKGGGSGGSDSPSTPQSEQGNNPNSSAPDSTPNTPDPGPTDSGADNSSGSGPAQPVVRSLTVNLNGLTPEDTTVTASGNGELHTATLQGDAYGFSNLTPNIEYSLKVQAPGYKQLSSVQSKPGGVASLNVEEQPSPDVDGKFTYTWKDDGQTVSGLEYASKVNKPVTVDIEGVERKIPNIAAAQMLYRDYRVVLNNTGSLQWTQAHAYRLLETLRQIPQKHCSLDQSVLGLSCKPDRNNIKKTVWKLSSSPVTNDIETSNGTVTLDAKAFTYAEPKIATVDGRRGRYFSKRLHHALIRQMTDGGQNLAKANYILEKRFGVTIDTRKNTGHSNLNSVYNNIAVTSEDRDASAWQSFTPEEILLIINQFEELPSGMHIIRGGANNKQGLKYLFRRANGHDHPLYPDAPAVAWPGAGYIEFMEKAFKGSNLEHMQRLVLHEKTHFLWHYNVSKQQKLKWLAFSEWYRVDGAEDGHLNDLPYSTENSGASHTHGSSYNPDNQNINVEASDGWSARKTTNFVSGYAQLKNPNEDLAESVSYFLMNPDKLRSRAPAKYEFIRDSLMAGVMYLQEIRDDLTFEVLNLHPDYIYPGKIKEVNIDVVGEAQDNKRVTIDLKLHTTKSSCKKDSCLEGASLAFTRIFSEIDTFKDIYFYPVSGRGSQSDHLRATFTLPDTAKNGWWAPAQITITDPLGNERYQRSTDYGWQMFINNPDEDITPPEYINDSLTLSLSDSKAITVANGRKTADLNTDNCSGQGSSCRVIRTITARWDVDEDVAMKDSNACFSRFAHQSYSNYSMDEYGEFQKNVQGIIDGQCQTQVTATEYYQSGEYRVAHVSMQDRALNRKSSQFSDNHPDREASPKVSLDNSGGNPDNQPPEMNIQPCADGVDRCISIKGTPTNPSKPDGETNVVLSYWVRDDKSGLGTVSYNLRDPQGVNHFYYASHDNTHTLFFNGEPTAWKKYTATETLPKGSAPGTWGLTEMTLYDKAGNKKSYDFTETVIFEAL
ncbi:hypothetical protein EOPP23_09810 [Endozoicomonas sp. OPT23]|uniref:hypothetical protein n=1 Tax=Endozoicomonas sp. OPT23 TaxID=2072845 RepID=UPI00129BACAB|nr:hypothetical protein [Endozoicomonas sp. OPT23]MRI33277.1 hypothetical protein [Endozoicomonas sp. OPT23]